MGLTEEEKEENEEEGQRREIGKIRWPLGEKARGGRRVSIV